MSVATEKRAYYNASQAARYLGVSRTTISRALNSTDPSSYPPPLEYDGRHGERGKFHIPHDALEQWSKRLRTFG